MTCSVGSGMDVLLHRVHARLDVELSMSMIRSQVRNLRFKQSFFCSPVLSEYFAMPGVVALLGRSTVRLGISFLSYSETDP